MEKLRNWCVVQVVLEVPAEHVEAVCRLLDATPGQAAEACYDEMVTVTAVTVTDQHFSGTQAGLLALLKRADDLLIDRRELLQQAVALYDAYIVTVVEVDFLYDPTVTEDACFSYHCFGTEDFLLWTDAWHACELWDGVTWDTRRVWQRVCDAPKLREVSAGELMAYLHGKRKDEPPA